MSKRKSIIQSTLIFEGEAFFRRTTNEPNRASLAVQSFHWFGFKASRSILLERSLCQSDHGWWSSPVRITWRCYLMSFLERKATDQRSFQSIVKRLTSVSSPRSISIICIDTDVSRSCRENDLNRYLRRLRERIDRYEVRSSWSSLSQRKLSVDSTCHQWYTTNSRKISARTLISVLFDSLVRVLCLTDLSAGRSIDWSRDQIITGWSEGLPWEIVHLH